MIAAPECVGVAVRARVLPRARLVVRILYALTAVLLNWINSNLQQECDPLFAIENNQERWLFRSCSVREQELRCSPYRHPASLFDFGKT